MERFRNILVAIDTRIGEHPIVDEAAEIASQGNALVKIVDVVPEFSWMARVTNPDLESMRESFSNEKKQILEAIAVPLREMGLDVKTSTLSGKTSVEIIREVIRGKHDLVMAVAKGENSTCDSFFGQTAHGLLRKCPCAVWLVTPGTPPKSKHVVGCVDVSSDRSSDAELNDNVYELALSISKYYGARFSILHAWRMEDESLLRRRMSSESIAELVMNDRQYKEKLFNKFLGRYDSSVESENVSMIEGLAPEVISTFVKTHRADLVVMGTVARSGVSGMLMGNTAEKILDRIECSVLALKPYNFKSPIQLD